MKPTNPRAAIALAQNALNLAAHYLTFVEHPDERFSEGAKRGMLDELAHATEYAHQAIAMTWPWSDPCACFVCGKPATLGTRLTHDPTARCKEHLDQ